MKLIWSKSKMPLSVVIRLITGEDCSHFAIVLYDGKPGEIMFESNLLGVHPSFFQSALKTHTIVHELSYAWSQQLEDIVWDRMVAQYDGRPYDFTGALYLGWRTLLLRFFGIPKPMKNKWAISGTDYCDELMGLLQGIPGIEALNVEGCMLTPHEVFKKLQVYANI